MFDDTPALGKDAKNVIGDMHSPMVANAYGVGGMGLVGTGDGGGGTGRRRSGSAASARWASSAGRRRRARLRRQQGGHHRYAEGEGPDIISSACTVRGSLDKEIIRRIVRRNINQVRYCYQQGLQARPSLEGRAVVQFTIAPTGQVLASVLQSSTLKAVAVESCVVNAVKRWEFPSLMAVAW